MFKNYVILYIQLFVCNPHVMWGIQGRYIHIMHYILYMKYLRMDPQCAMLLVCGRLQYELE